jgi:hypothetical protein
VVLWVSTKQHKAGEAAAVETVAGLRADDKLGKDLHRAAQGMQEHEDKRLTTQTVRTGGVVLASLAFFEPWRGRPRFSLICIQYRVLLQTAQPSVTTRGRGRRPPVRAS